MLGEDHFRLIVAELQLSAMNDNLTWFGIDTVAASIADPDLLLTVQERNRIFGLLLSGFDNRGPSQKLDLHIDEFVRHQSNTALGTHSEEDAGRKEHVGLTVMRLERYILGNFGPATGPGNVRLTVQKNGAFGKQD